MVRVLVDVGVDENVMAELMSRHDLEFLRVDPEEVVRRLPAEIVEAAEILFCTFPPANFDEMRNLRWIQIASTGYSQLLPLKLPERGIRACNSRGCFDVPIAEWNIAMMVNLVRDLPGMFRNQQAHVWDRSARFQKEIRGLTVGIWGYGGIGRETARVARQFGMRVHVLSRRDLQPRIEVYQEPGTGDPEGRLPHRIFRQGEEQAFLSGLDFLILAMPLTPQTEGIVGEKELRALPDRCYVLNPARGPLIEERALLRALRENWIAGAALDTHYAYPMPADHPLWDLPNVIFTPHISGSSRNSMFLTRLWQIFRENVERFLEGRNLLNELTPEQLWGQ